MKRTVFPLILTLAFGFFALGQIAPAGAGFDPAGIGRFFHDKIFGTRARRRHRAHGRARPAPEALYPVTFKKTGSLPLPRFRPAALSVQAPPATAARTVPLPRPRPEKIARKNSPGEAVAITGTGKVVVRLEKLGKERDPNASAKLVPNENATWNPREIREAQKRCAIILAATNIAAKPLSPIGGPGGCGVAAPLMVSALGAVEVTPPVKINCTLAAAAYKWITDVVQPAARRHLGAPVVGIRQFSGYACRRRIGITKGPVRISEHSFGNAIDVAWFVLADGRKVSVLHDWGGISALFNKKAAFLREVHKKACGIFSTVLGPEANAAHKNHFHFDLGRGGRYKYCH